MRDVIINNIQDRSITILDKIKATLDATADGVLEKPTTGWPLWKQFYHVLYWLDYWFIDPTQFAPPDFHEPQFMSPDNASQKTLSKNDLLQYYSSIRSRMERHIKTLTLEKLQQEADIRGSIRSRLDMILGQFIHVSHHIGYICSSVRTETGQSLWSAAE